MLKKQLKMITVDCECIECSLPPSLPPSLPQVVAPKKERLAEAEKSFSETMTDLNAKRAELKEVHATAH